MHLTKSKGALLSPFAFPASVTLVYDVTTIYITGVACHLLNSKEVKGSTRSILKGQEYTQLQLILLNKATLILVQDPKHLLYLWGRLLGQPHSVKKGPGTERIFRWYHVGGERRDDRGKRREGRRRNKKRYDKHIMTGRSLSSGDNNMIPT